MSLNLEVRVHSITQDGLPDMDNLTGRVAFIFDGCIISGWPAHRDTDKTMLWEGDSDVSSGKLFHGVTHWVEFPLPMWEIEK